MPFRYVARYKVFLTCVGTEETDGTIVFGCRCLVCRTDVECDHRLFGGMCILFLPQISLPRTPALPGELAVVESSSLNNMDRKCWSV